jgi:hypothetical protein
MRGPTQPTWKQIVLGLEPRASNPRENRFAGWLGDFKLDRTLGLLLQDNGPRGDAIAAGDIPNAQPRQIAAPQFAVDCKIEQRQLAPSLAEFKADPDGPNIFELERGFFARRLYPCSMVRGVRV